MSQFDPSNGASEATSIPRHEGKMDAEIPLAPALRCRTLAMVDLDRTQGLADGAVRRSEAAEALATS